MTFIDFLGLSRPLRVDSAADPGDLFRTKAALNRLGHFPTPPYGINEYAEEGLFSGIKRFQRENGLKVDGIMNPGGETERAMERSLSEASSLADASRNARRAKDSSMPRRDARTLFETRLGGDAEPKPNAITLFQDRLGAAVFPRPR